MNTHHDDHNTQPADDAERGTEPQNPDASEAGGATASTPGKPLGAWLGLVDGLMRREFAALFAERGLTRGDWRRLNQIAGTVRDEHVAARMAARPDRVERLIDRGWVTGQTGDWSLTGAGREALDELTNAVQGLRDRIAGAASPEDFATMLATLEAIAAELGYDPAVDARPHRGRGGRGRRGFGPFGRRGFGGRGFGPHGFGGEHPFAGHPHGDPRFAPAARAHGRPDAEHGPHGFGHGRDHGAAHEHGYGHDHGYGYGHPAGRGCHRAGFDRRDAHRDHPAFHHGHPSDAAFGAPHSRRGGHPDVHVHIHTHRGH